MVSTKIIIIFQERWFNIPKEGKRIFKHSSGNRLNHWVLNVSCNEKEGEQSPASPPYPFHLLHSVKDRKTTRTFHLN